MTIDERIKKIYDEYWITISYDLTLYSKDRRYTRYKIAWPKLIPLKDGTYDLDLKDPDVDVNIQGRDIPYYIALKRRIHPEYMKILKEIVARKKAEWEAKKNGQSN